LLIKKAKKMAFQRFRHYGGASIAAVKSIARRSARAAYNAAKRSKKMPMWAWVAVAALAVVFFVKPARAWVMGLFHKAS